ncbi:MAG: hypothetical protein INQ03_22095 [Candidatus Heimdallarchaeota archaeon]|nr:hypothetical protein [Candidatus Heimdallarchaeota archaeon]
MNEYLNKGNESRSSLDQSQEECEELYSRLGWKWAVLATSVHNLLSTGTSVSDNLISRIKTSRIVVESGCYSTCAALQELQDIEREVFQYVIDKDISQVDRFYDLLGKAMQGSIREEDLEIANPKTVLSDCLSLPCSCT